MYKKKNNLVKFVILNSIIIFLLGFVTHNLYEWIPSFLTVIFPVNESLFEHLKMIFITPIVIGIIWYVISLYKEIHYNNYFLSLYIAVMSNIAFFYAIYLPIYYRFSHNMLITLIIYFISIIISQIINTLILNKTKNKLLLNIIGIVLLSINYVVLLYFTYNPMKSDFFFDPINKVYGIYK